MKHNQIRLPIHLQFFANQLEGVLSLEEFKRETLLGFIQALEMPFEQKLLRFLPRDKKVFSLSFAYDIVTKAKSTAAQILEFGAPAPLRDKGTVERAMAEVAKIANKHRFDQRDQLTIMNTRFDQERQQVIDRALQDVATLIEDVYKTEEWMRAAALYYGVMQYNFDGVVLDIDFGIPSGNKVVLTGTEKWDQYETANPMQDLIEWTQEFKRKNADRAPQAIHMSFSAFWDMVKCKSTINAIKGIVGGTIAPDEVNAYLKRFNIPPIEIQDFVVDFEDGTRRLLPENRVALLGIQGVQLGSTVEGPTVENGGQPGVYTRTWQEDNTLNQFVEVGKAAFPELQYPTGVMHFDVK
ncbi:major capsid protein [Aneurinibacillus aneurinilyticus]|uniref:major capsid protein n=1 Tax=Aneurinibacillus aneurinilyticus TaxID=1391 RepID=UPI003524F5AA